jgi:putative ABC transport system substrate-binding protein
MSGKIIIFFLLLTLLLATTYSTEAQQPGKVPRVGVLLPSPTGFKTYFASFRQGLEELGYIEGHNIIIEYRVAQPKSGEYEQYVELAAELVSLNVHVIVTSSAPAIQAVKNTTRTIPIVMGAAADPVGTGLVASLARPGGNVTGLSMRSTEIIGKRLELIREVVPKARRVGILWNPTNPSHLTSLRDSQIAAQAMGLHFQAVELQNPGDFDRGFRALTIGRTDAFTVPRDSFFLINLTRFVEFAVKSRLPVVDDGTEFVLAGGLMSYAANHLEVWRRAATYVDKILKGAKPTDLPVEQPMRTEFIINLKAAKEIGLTIPPEVLQRANKVIR